ncbi:MAG: ABC transporter ATP-binding protein [Bacillota bacterium]|nr:ABC transporter ATP-binding protein [Eubacteriales bacterium]MDI9492311.1 ABC transporter ATP-binding protein [Bacillota bacterium]NLV69833.1 ABC transporter ATP-binding protein [Clostridiales bacterium]MDD3536772.1 ABC transporter ATP-binding protein [Eubacteriales bacterium]MDD4285385.1 ABC transporter ATP-binding protein [Eubacteriales bacterium]
MDTCVLDVKNLYTVFYSGKKEIPAVEDLSFSVKKGETLGIVGESGSGKSVTALSIMNLIPDPPGKIARGEILLNGTDLLALSREKMRVLRGNQLSMIFQEPMTSLNPVYTIGNQLMESLILHKNFSFKEAAARSVEMLKSVRVPLPEKRMKQYPHQLSGGMRQRVMIAMALSCEPDLLIADEPTTALDVTIQAQILSLIKELKEKMGTSVLLITHNMGVVAEVADQVMVMYCGRDVEYADVRTIFKSPKHPYTAGLIESIPAIRGTRKRLHAIKGSIPMPGEITTGCRFQTRCDEAFEKCFNREPPMFQSGDTKVRCWKYESQG